MSLFYCVNLYVSYYYNSDNFKEWLKLAKREYHGKNLCKPLTYEDIIIEIEEKKKKEED